MHVLLSLEGDKLGMVAAGPRSQTALVCAQVQCAFIVAVVFACSFPEGKCKPTALDGDTGPCMSAWPVAGLHLPTCCTEYRK